MKKLYLLLALTGVLFQANALHFDNTTTYITNTLPLPVSFNLSANNGMTSGDTNFNVPAQTKQFEPGHASFSVQDANGSTSEWNRYISYKVTVKSKDNNNSLRIRNFAYVYNRYDYIDCGQPFRWFNDKYTGAFATYKMCGETQPTLFSTLSTGSNVQININNLLDIKYIVGNIHDEFPADIIKRCDLSAPGATVDDIEEDLINHGKIAYKQPIYCSRADTPDVMNVENKDFDYFGALSAKFDKGQACIVQVDNEGHIGCL